MLKTSSLPFFDRRVERQALRVFRWLGDVEAVRFQAAPVEREVQHGALHFVGAQVRERFREFSRRGDRRARAVEADCFARRDFGGAHGPRRHLDLGLDVQHSRRDDASRFRTSRRIPFPLSVRPPAQRAPSPRAAPPASRGRQSNQPLSLATAWRAYLPFRSDRPIDPRAAQAFTHPRGHSSWPVVYPRASFLNAAARCGTGEQT